VTVLAQASTGVIKSAYKAGKSPPGIRQSVGWLVANVSNKVTQVGAWQKASSSAAVYLRYGFHAQVGGNAAVMLAAQSLSSKSERSGVVGQFVNAVVGAGVDVVGAGVGAAVVGSGVGAAVVGAGVGAAVVGAGVLAPFAHASTGVIKSAYRFGNSPPGIWHSVG
jgi:small-conductance mechanosensitive channel